MFNSSYRVVRSLDVGVGDMFYINHGRCFTIIDCNYTDNDNLRRIQKELKYYSPDVFRFISTHPDKDHFYGIKEYTSIFCNPNFYWVENKVQKDDVPGFDDYRKCMQSAWGISKGIKRAYLNESKDGINSSCIEFLWPVRDNKYFIAALETAENGGKCNNISPIFTYTSPEGLVFMWMGDMETDMMNNIKGSVAWPENIDVLFAPHHGRSSAKVPEDILKKLNPQVIVLGEADSDDLDYYKGYSDIAQNSAGDITFHLNGFAADVYFSSDGSYVPSSGDWISPYNSIRGAFGRIRGTIRRDRIYR